MKQYTESSIQQALSQYYDWRKVKCYRNVVWGWGITDFLAISGAGYATEVEIKISLGDWKADASKEKWKHPQKSSMFYYAIPHPLLVNIPAHVRPEWGIIVVKDTGYTLQCETFRKATRVAGKITDADRKNLHNHTYYHYWEKAAKV